jgi:hypothetical protein
MSCYSAAEEIRSICADFLVEQRGFELWTSELTSGIFSRRASRFWRFVIPVVVRAGNAAESIDSTEYDKSTVGTLNDSSSARALVFELRLSRAKVTLMTRNIADRSNAAEDQNPIF